MNNTTLSWNYSETLMYSKNLKLVINLVYQFVGKFTSIPLHYFTKLVNLLVGLPHSVFATELY